VLDAAGGCTGSDVAKRLAQQDLSKLQTAGTLICRSTECQPSGRQLCVPCSCSGVRSAWAESQAYCTHTATLRCLQHCNCCASAASTAYAGATTKPLTHSNSSANLTDQQQLDTLAATPAAANSSSRDTSGGSSTAAAATAAAAVLQQEVGRLRQEVSCLRTTLGTLYVTCSHLKEVRCP
jgi:hypothetical protein